MPGISVIIPNFNYGKYVGAAIDSAIAQMDVPVQVIVVDDGSTDSSRTVINQYGSRITTIFQKNGGHMSACVSGLAAAEHGIVLFLDSDDMLLPEAAKVIAACWQPALVKLQFRMETCDAEGRGTGHLWPKYPAGLTADRVKRELLRTGFYPSPPTSGNAFAKWFIERASPLEGHDWIDSVLNTIAPLYGEVKTISDRLVYYRSHGENSWAQHNLTPQKFDYYSSSERTRATVLESYCRRLGVPIVGFDVVERSFRYRQLQLARAKLASPHGFSRDVLAEGARTVRVALTKPSSSWHSMLNAGWSAAVTLAPLSLARWLIALRYVPRSRPQLVERLINAFNGAAPARWGRSG